MKNYKEIYNSKLGTVEDALALIQDGDNVYFAGNACRPMSLLNNLHKLIGKRKDVTVIPTAGLDDMFPFVTNPESKQSFNIASTFYGYAEMEAHKLGFSSYMPNHLHNGTFRMYERYPVDVFAASVTAMDDNGFMQFSLDNISELTHVRTAKANGKKIILEVNKKMPKVFGDTFVPIEWADLVIEVDYEVETVPNLEAGEVEMQIGKNVASLVEDGSTIQLGFGKIPNAVASYLDNKNDLGVHTEMITSNMAELAKMGVINGRKKTLDWGKMVGCFALGLPSLYEYIHDNPAVAIKPGRYTNDPKIIAKQHKMVSINAAIQVDLTGQICSESIGATQFSGTGGAQDFAVGANHSKGGKSIIALRSTARKDTISTIQPILSPGAVVSIHRNDIDYIVTEYGIAYLRGKTIAERLEKLIAIAHPKFRDELLEKAKEYKIII